MTTDDALLRGAQFARDHLQILDRAYRTKSTMAYAGAMVSGIANWVAHKFGTRAAYDLLVGLADEILARDLQRDNAGEGEV